jgi:hypothetical protein
MRNRKTLLLCVSAVGVVATALALERAAPSATATATGTQDRPRLVGVPSAVCPTAATPLAEREASNPRARAAAQRGLTFLARETQAWQAEHRCFGCHVHAVTLEAFVVGRHNQYELPERDLKAVLGGMLDVPGGAHRPGGFSYADNSLWAPAKAFGGAALAHYDQWIDSGLRNDLVKAAEELLRFQRPDGSIELDWVNPPVGAGVIQGTYQAAQTWQQVYARTADSRWLLPLQHAESFLHAAALAQLATPGATIQDLNYALMGLGAAGAGSSDDTVRKLAALLVTRQHPDGGWGLAEADASGAFATGQTLYALRVAGMTDRDAPLARGTAWLIARQAEDGGWSHTGSGKAEAMWGVLGLVSVDVLSVASTGLQDGAHVIDHQPIGIEAHSNDPAAGVTKVELMIDDVRVRSACAATMAYTWDTASAEPGKHVVDLLATNAKGQTSRRRLEVYAGAVYLTQIGVRSSEQGTEVSLRDLATDGAGSVELQIRSADGARVIATVSRPSQPGAMSLAWDGTTPGGARAPEGKYVARLALRAGGAVIQTEDVPFVRGSEATQRANYAEVGGQLALPDGAAAANAAVELVDDNDRVVQQVRSTKSGQYRFKGVDAGQYKVRVRKQGFDKLEAPVSAVKSREATQELRLK